MAGKKKSTSTRDLKARPVKASESRRVKGGAKGTGKVSMQDFHFTKGVNSTSP